jgi:hypothetical protein
MSAARSMTWIALIERERGAVPGTPVKDGGYLSRQECIRSHIFFGRNFPKIFPSSFRDWV